MSQVNDITYIEEIGILQLYLGTAQLGVISSVESRSISMISSELSSPLPCPA